MLSTGAAIIGFLAWPLAKPLEPYGVVSVFAGNISFGSAITLAVLAFLVGLSAYFISWPYGRQIAVLAVPAGLAIWAVRGGSVANMIQTNPAVAQRQAFFAAIRWESFFWLAIVAVGFAGMFLAAKIFPSKPKIIAIEQKSKSDSGKYLNIIIAFVGSGLIAQLCLGIFAQDVRILDGQLGSITAQPAIGQVVFAVLVSFGIAAFVVKKFLDAGFFWPLIAGIFVTAFAYSAHARVDILQYLVQNRPAGFFSNAVASILPVQIIAFGTLGSVAGYWLAVRYDYWRKHEIT